MTKKLFTLFALVVALILSLACHKIDISDDGTGLYVKTLSAETYASGEVSTATLHGLLTKKVQMVDDPESYYGFDYPDCGFEWGQDAKMSNGVKTQKWMDAEGESSDQPVSEWRGFKAHLGVLNPSTTYYYRAYVVVGGKRCYGNIKSFNTPDVIVTDIVLTPESAIILIDADPNLQLLAEVYPGKAKDKTLNWESSDESIATVDEYGHVTALKEGAVVITASSVQNPSVKATCSIKIVLKIAEDAVDMGLNSGKLWHKMNLGAASEYDKGDFYSWGETKPKTTFKQKDYKYFVANTKDENPYAIYSSNKYTSSHVDYVTGANDGLSELEDSDDAARLKLGEGWHIPSLDEWQELLGSCSRRSQTVDGVDCVILKSNINGNQLILPMTGQYYSYEGKEEYKKEGTHFFCWLRDAAFYKRKPAGQSPYYYAIYAFAADAMFEDAVVGYEQEIWRSDGLPIRPIYYK